MANVELGLTSTQAVDAIQAASKQLFNWDTAHAGGKIVVTDSNGYITASNHNSSLLAFLSGLTGNTIQTQLDLKAPINNPTFTGTVTIPETPTNDTDAASKGYVDTHIKGCYTKGLSGSSGDQTLTDADTWYVLEYPDTINTTGTGDFTEAANVVTIVKAGLYAIAFSGLYSSDKVNPVVYASVFKGTTTPDTETHIRSGGKLGAVGEPRTGGSYGVISLSAGDKICVKIKSSIAANTVTHNGMSLSIIRLG